MSLASEFSRCNARNIMQDGGITWQCVLYQLANTSLYSYKAGTLIYFKDGSSVVIELDPKQILYFDNKEDFTIWYDQGIINGSSLPRELYEAKVAADRALKDWINSIGLSTSEKSSREYH